MRIGERVSAKDIKVQEVPSRGAEGFGRVLRDQREDRDSVINQFLTQDVRADDYVQWSHVSGSEEARSSYKIDQPGLRIDMPIETLTSPGSDMSPGDRINLVGRFNVDGKLEAVRVIENVRVLAVGGQGMGTLSSSGGGSSSSRSKGSYRSIGIEVTSEVSLQLQNLRSHLVGEYVIELRNPRDQTLSDTDESGTINKKLQGLVKAATIGRRDTPGSLEGR